MKKRQYIIFGLIAVVLTFAVFAMISEMLIEDPTKCLSLSEKVLNHKEIQPKLTPQEMQELLQKVKSTDDYFVYFLKKIDEGQTVKSVAEKAGLQADMLAILHKGWTLQKQQGGK